jgi:geranylgeranyl diphosphate synthase, type I
VEDRFSQFSLAVDNLTRELLVSQPQYDGLYDMLRWHVGWIDEQGTPVNALAGKKLRPALCLLVAEAVDGDWRLALPAAASVELIHNFSLIHDDIEDQSSLRRHRTTVWARWGLAHGINAGDAVLILAQQALIEHAPAESALAALRILNRACRGLCEGQYLDMLWEKGPVVTVDEYLEMIERKTARLFQTSAELGALAGGATDEEREGFGAFGSSLGLAFQVVDDLLGVWAPEIETGKTAALDIATKKKAIPAILALSKAGPQVERFRALYNLDRQLTPEETAEAIDILDGLGIREETTAFASRYRLEALERLDGLSERPEVAPLRDFLVATLPNVS